MNMNLTVIESITSLMTEPGSVMAQVRVLTELLLCGGTVIKK